MQSNLQSNLRSSFQSNLQSNLFQANLLNNSTINNFTNQSFNPLASLLNVGLQNQNIGLQGQNGVQNGFSNNISNNLTNGLSNTLQNTLPIRISNALSNNLPNNLSNNLNALNSNQTSTSLLPDYTTLYIQNLLKSAVTSDMKNSSDLKPNSNPLSVPNSNVSSGSQNNANVVPNLNLQALQLLLEQQQKVLNNQASQLSQAEVEHEESSIEVDNDRENAGDKRFDIKSLLSPGKKE